MRGNVITLRRSLLVNKALSVKANVYVRNKRTRAMFSLGEYTKKKCFGYCVNLADWDLFALGNSYLSEKTRKDREDIEGQILHEWGDRECYNCPVLVCYFFGVPMPSSESFKRKQELLFTHVGKRPDEGNYTYAMDNRLEGIAFVDDKLICAKMVSKVYTVTPVTIIGVFPIAEKDFVSHQPEAFVTERAREEERQRSLLCVLRK